MPLIKINTIFNIDLEFEIAEIHKRIFAYLIDFCILILYFMSMKYLYYGGTDQRNLESHVGIDILTISFPMLMYSLVCEVMMNGQTVGKKLLNTRVISLDGSKPSISQYLIRWMFKAFEWPFFFGYTLFSGEMLIAYIIITAFSGIVVVIIISSSKRNQRIGDMAANTAVVNTRTPFTVNDTIFMDIKEENYAVTFPEVLKLSDRDITTIKDVMNLYYTDRKIDTCIRVTNKVKEVLQIESGMQSIHFLETLLADYNYLGSK